MMEKNKKEGIKEPYRPEDTPRPPQKVRPHGRTEDRAKGGSRSEKEEDHAQDSKTG